MFSVRCAVAACGSPCQADDVCGQSMKKIAPHRLICYGTCARRTTDGGSDCFGMSRVGTGMSMGLSKITPELRAEMSRCVPMHE